MSNEPMKNAIEPDTLLIEWQIFHMFELFAGDYAYIFIINIK